MYTKIPVELNEKLYKFPHEEVEFKLKWGVLLLGIKVLHARPQFQNCKNIIALQTAEKLMKLNTVHSAIKWDIRCRLYVRHGIVN